MKILLVWPNRELPEFIDGFYESNVEIVWHSSGEDALKYAKDNSDITLATISENLSDMSGLEFTQKLMSVNAMIGCAVASNLPGDEFHEESEGLGILMQLPLKPDAESAKKLLAHLARIGMISSKTTAQNI